MEVPRPKIILQPNLTKENNAMTTERWAIDTAHSSVDFVARHMMVSKIRGTFGEWSGVIDVDLEDPAMSAVTATIAVASISTRDKKRDVHLLLADFAAAIFSTIMFTSRRIEINGRDLRVSGDLSIRGVVKDVTLEVQYNGMNQDPWGNKRIHLPCRRCGSQRENRGR